MVLVIQSTWSGAGVTGGGKTTLAFANPSSGTNAEVIANALDEMWTGLCANILSADVSVQVDSAGSVYASGDGSLQEVYDLGAYDVRTGAVGGAAVPKATQALVRLGTAGIVANRLVKGRVFIPGMPSAALNTAGELSSSYRNTLRDAFTDFLDAINSTLEVWSRPKTTSPARAGSEHLVTSIDVWNQLAVLRSRRD